MRSNLAHVVVIGKKKEKTQKKDKVRKYQTRARRMKNNNRKCANGMIDGTCALTPSHCTSTYQL